MLRGWPCQVQHYAPVGMLSMLRATLGHLSPWQHTPPEHKFHLHCVTHTNAAIVSLKSKSCKKNNARDAVHDHSRPVCNIGTLQVCRLQHAGMQSCVT